MNETVRVLLVEDNPADVVLIREILSEAGAASFRIESVPRLSEALSRLKAGAIDVVLLDLGLPDSQGLATFVKLHQAAPDIAIVVLSGNINQETAIAAVREGAQDYFVKGQISGNLIERAARYAMERKRALVEAEQRATLLNALINSAGDTIIFSLDRDHRYTAFNEQHREEMRRVWKAEIAVGMSLPDLMTDADIRAMAVRSIERALGGESFTEISHQPQTDAWYEFSWNPIRQADGEINGLTAYIRDITRRKRAEAERERLMTAIEQAGETVMITDREGTIQYVNPAFETLSGHARGEVLGRNPRFLKSGRQDEAFYRELWGTITSGRTWQGRMVNKRKDGSLYTEEAAIYPVADASGHIVNFVAVKRDVTEHLRLTEQLQQAQKMESVGRLAGGVAHDFNNMLSVILGNADLALMNVGPGQPLHANLIEILKAAQRSADITRQLLAFARKQTISPKVLDLNRTIEGMLKMLRRLIGEDIDLAWSPDAGLWPVNVDPAQVDQVLANLCVNARDAIADVGKVTIETRNLAFDAAYCSHHPGFVPGEYVRLAVSDDGCGMDRETLSQIFEPFFTTKGVGEGTGLGLSTVFGIVRQNNGFIGVDSEPGKGTTFNIYLPRRTGESRESPAASAAENPPGRGETVLLVEDEASILDLGKRMLESLGYAVLDAHSSRDAMRLAGERAGGIDLLITDVVLPEMNGRELSERLRSACPGLRTLFMSGYTADVIAHRGVLDEGVQFIQKPFSLQELAAKVRQALDRQ